MNYRKKHRATENGHLLEEMTETFRTSLAKTMNWCHLPVKVKIPKYIYNKRPYKDLDILLLSVINKTKVLE